MTFLREIMLHGAAGILWGYLYWRHGLIAAIVGHIGAHVALEPLLSCCSSEARVPEAGGGDGGSLSGLSDVNVSEGAGIDGKVLTWDNATSKWIAAVSTGGTTYSSGAGLTLTGTTFSVNIGTDVQAYDAQPRTIFSSSNAFSIGSNTANSAFWFNGFIDELRITKGLARYASDSGFTVPTAAFPRS